jgi:hypothetical protein
MPARPRPSGDPQACLFGPWAFSIAAARDILAAAPRPPASLPVGPWTRAFCFALGPGHVSLLGPGPGFDPAYALTTDLADPVIVALLAKVSRMSARWARVCSAFRPGRALQGVPPSGDTR